MWLIIIIIIWILLSIFIKNLDLNSGTKWGNEIEIDDNINWYKIHHILWYIDIFFKAKYEDKNNNYNKKGITSNKNTNWYFSLMIQIMNILTENEIMIWNKVINYINNHQKDFSNYLHNQEKSVKGFWYIEPLEESIDNDNKILFLIKSFIKNEENPENETTYE